MIKICKRIIRILQLIKRWISTTYMSVMGEVIILCTPNHENLGDHAIALAEYQLLYSIKPNIKIFDIVGKARRFQRFLYKIVHRHIICRFLFTIENKLLPIINQTFWTFFDKFVKFFNIVFI